MSVTDRREDNLAYLKATTLLLPSGTGNYVNNLQAANVKRAFRSMDELAKDELPLVFILDDNLTLYTPLTAREYTTGETKQDVTRGMIIGLLGFVTTDRVSDDGALSQATNDLRRDLIIAMHEDLSLGGNCLSVTLRSDLHSIEYSESKGLGMLIQTYSIKYDFNPRAANPSV